MSSACFEVISDTSAVAHANWIRCNNLQATWNCRFTFFSHQSQLALYSIDQLASEVDIMLFTVPWKHLYAMKFIHSERCSVYKSQQAESGENVSHNICIQPRRVKWDGTQRRFSLNKRQRVRLENVTTCMSGMTVGSLRVISLCKGSRSALMWRSDENPIEWVSFRWSRETSNFKKRTNIMEQRYGDHSQQDRLFSSHRHMFRDYQDVSFHLKRIYAPWSILCTVPNDCECDLLVLADKLKFQP